MIPQIIVVFRTNCGIQNQIRSLPSIAFFVWIIRLRTLF